MQTLKIYQNGIRTIGASSISDVIRNNKNIEVFFIIIQFLDFNDNLFLAAGAKLIAKVLKIIKGAKIY